MGARDTAKPRRLPSRPGMCGPPCVDSKDYPADAAASTGTRTRGRRGAALVHGAADAALKRKSAEDPSNLVDPRSERVGLKRIPASTKRAGGGAPGPGVAHAHTPV